MGDDVQADRTPAARRVTLRPVDETVLALLVAAALADAGANEVTPPVTPGENWSPERVEWLRGLHRTRRAGLSGPAGEATWAIDVDGQVVGSVRLKRLDGPAVVETGMWLTRDARGRGIGGQALRAVLETAVAGGTRTVRAETTRGNGAALAVLSRLGFRFADGEGETVRAVWLAPSDTRTARGRAAEGE